MTGSLKHVQSLIVGNPDGMEDAVSQVLLHSESAQFEREVNDFTPFIETPPDLVLVCQQWPDEYTNEFVAELIATFPLSRLICSYSRWCGSDGRTRNIWPASVRVEAAKAARRVQQEVEVISGLRDPLPLTAGLDEVFLFDHS